MPDRENAIKGLEFCSKHDGSECPQCPYFNGECVDNLCADAIALLKEQEDEIKELRSIVEFWKNKALHT